MNRRAVLRNAGVVVLLYAAAIGVAYRFVWMERTHLAGFAVAFSATQATLVGVICFFLAGSKTVRQIRARRFLGIRPRIIEGMCGAAQNGRGAASELRSLAQKNRRAVEQCLLDTLPVIGGSARLRLSGIAAELGYVREWKAGLRSHLASRRRRSAFALALLAPPCREGVCGDRNGPGAVERICDQAERAVTQPGDPAPIAALFNRLSGMPLIERALLADHLRPHAARLSEQVLPRALAAGDPGCVLSTLEMIEAWKRMLPLPSLYPLLRSPDARVRASALRAVVYEAGSRNSGDLAALVPDLLKDREPEVRRAAADAAGWLRLDQAIGPLREALSDADAEVVRCSCQALAALGRIGRCVLEQEIVAGTAAACAATEVLERARIQDRG